jgi:hypothetical protein
MGKAKDIILRPVDRATADELVKRVHYSGKVVPNSQLHIGVFYRGRLEGAMQFGPSMDKRKVGQLVTGTKWHQFIELNRLAFTDVLPRNSESRAIAIAMRILRQNAPQIKWVISYADATQCGDGTIYRASGFILTGIRKNGQILDWNGRLIARKTLDNKNYPSIDGKYFSRYLKETGQATPIDGFQLRYIYFIDPSWRRRLAVPELPYSAIQDAGAGMYRGEKR